MASNGTVDPRFKDLKSHIDEILEAATKDLAAGSIYSSLDKLGQASDFLGGIRAAANEAEVIQGGLPAFEVERKRASRHVSEISPAPPRTPAAIRALVDTARVKAAALLDGGRGFATSMKPQDGLFYVGEAEGLAEFAGFCARLGANYSGQAANIRSVAPELRALQDKTDAAFVPPVSIEKHPSFIGLNSSIKLARELEEAKLYS